MLKNAGSKADRLVTNFTLWEMANNQDEGALIITTEVVRHAQMLQQLRDWYQQPLNVNSWFRTPAFNKKINGSSNSCHLEGIATDISLPNLTNSQRSDFVTSWRQICREYGAIGGVSLYTWGIHFDSNADSHRYTTGKSFRISDFK